MSQGCPECGHVPVHVEMRGRWLSFVGEYRVTTHRLCPACGWWVMRTYEG